MYDDDWILVSMDEIERLSNVGLPLCPFSPPRPRGWYDNLFPDDVVQTERGAPLPIPLTGTE